MTRKKVLAALQSEAETSRWPATSDSLAKRIGLPVGTVSGALLHLREEGMVVGDNKGNWWIPETPFHTAPCRLSWRLYGPTSVADRLQAIECFNEHQLRRALEIKGLQKEVKRAIERMLQNREWRSKAWY